MERRRERFAVPWNEPGTWRDCAKVPADELRVQSGLIGRQYRDLEVRVRSRCAPEKEIESPASGDPPLPIPSSHRSQCALTYVGERVRFTGGQRGRFVMGDELFVGADTELGDLEHGVDRQLRRIDENRDAANRLR